MQTQRLSLVQRGGPRAASWLARHPAPRAPIRLTPISAGALELTWPAGGNGREAPPAGHQALLNLATNLPVWQMVTSKVLDARQRLTTAPVPGAGAVDVASADMMVQDMAALYKRLAAAQEAAQMAVEQQQACKLHTAAIRATVKFLEAENAGLRIALATAENQCRAQAKSQSRPYLKPSPTLLAAAASAHLQRTLHRLQQEQAVLEVRLGQACSSVGAALGCGAPQWEPDQLSADTHALLTVPELTLAVAAAETQARLARRDANLALDLLGILTRSKEHQAIKQKKLLRQWEHLRVHLCSYPMVKEVLDDVSRLTHANTDLRCLVLQAEQAAATRTVM